MITNLFSLVSYRRAASAVALGFLFVASMAGDPNAQPPFITSQPANLVSPVGQAVLFGVGVTGTAPFTYQWLKNNTAITGATAATYGITSPVAADAGDYSVVVTNAFGSVTSLSAVLTINAAPIAPAITTQPASLSVVTGQTVTFTVVATGSPLLTYQWTKDRIDITGANSATFMIPSAALTDAATYAVRVANSAATVTSAGATLTVTAGMVAPTITKPIADVTVTAGQTASFTATATGTSPLTFQWRKAGANIAGATSATYTIATTATSDAGSYSVVVTNSAGSATSNNATLTVNPVLVPPVITSQPVSQVATVGHNVSFTAASSSGTRIWQVSADGGGTWSTVSSAGATVNPATGTLTLSGVSLGLSGNLYRLQATNTDGTADSVSALLTVTAALLPAPSSIGLDVNGTIYIGDATGDTISQVSANGVVAVLAGTTGMAGSTDGTGSAARFNQPGGVVVMPSGVIFVADTANSTIRRIGTDGVVSTFAGSTSQRGNANGTGTAATFANPLGIAADAAGNLYVADAGNHTIRKITPTAVVTTYAGGAGTLGTADGPAAAARFNTPSGVAVDGAGNVFVADTANSTIRKITPTGTVSTFAGLAGVGGATDGAGAVALFTHPLGIAADMAGYVYVADTGNSTIRRITPDGLVSTLAGLATISGLEDGVGIGALFSQPKALALDNVGKIYVADTGNAAVRVVTSGGAVTTITLTAALADTSGGSGSGGGTGGGTGGGGTGGGSSSGGGGGSIDGWLVCALGILAMGRRSGAGRARRRLKQF